MADEVYAGLAPGGRVPGLAARLPEQVVTISSLSKSHAMTGWRAGWLVGPRALCVHAEALLLSMVYGLPGFIQAAALTALEISDETEASIRNYCALRGAAARRSGTVPRTSSFMNRGRHVHAGRCQWHGL